MKNVEDAFREAERLKLPSGLWERIASRVDFTTEEIPGNRQSSRLAVLWGKTGIRLAASLALAALLIGLGLRAQTGFKNPEGAPPRDSVNGEVIDSELLAWSADLGESEEETQDPVSWSEK